MEAVPLDFNLCDGLECFVYPIYCRFKIVYNLKIVHAAVEREDTWERLDSPGLDGGLVLPALVTPRRCRLFRTQGRTHNFGEVNSF